uniref:CCR4-NOT transcription complex subunit 9 n=1 Tax=Steinernema glaseri TaxID=37863 RepID=A0A1I7ZG81_9BILA
MRWKIQGPMIRSFDLRDYGSSPDHTRPERLIRPFLLLLIVNPKARLSLDAQQAASKHRYFADWPIFSVCLLLRHESCLRFCLHACLKAFRRLMAAPTEASAADEKPEETLKKMYEDVYGWINDLADPDKREVALLELSKKREMVGDLAIWIWHSFGTMAALLQEVISVYPTIMPPTLTAIQSNRVCNALALMQCVASHRDTRGPFLQAHIPLFLYPFLHTTKTTRPFEYLRLTSLGVIGALVKNDEQEVIQFLLSTEIIPLCLRIMEQGTELSRTVATFILQKILLDDTGLNYICQTYERFSHVAMILGKMVLQLAKEPSGRLLKHVVRCYSRLSDNTRALQALHQCLPDQLKDETFVDLFKEDKSTYNWWLQLLKNLGLKSEAEIDAMLASFTERVPLSGGGDN